MGGGSLLLTKHLNLKLTNKELKKTYKKHMQGTTNLQWCLKYAHDSNTNILSKYVAPPSPKRSRMAFCALDAI